MTVSELIDALQEILAVDGDWEVHALDMRQDTLLTRATPFPVEDLPIDKQAQLVILE
jgi:hypothetical protein